MEGGRGDVAACWVGGLRATKYCVSQLYSALCSVDCEYCVPGLQCRPQRFLVSPARSGAHASSHCSECHSGPALDSVPIAEPQPCFPRVQRVDGQPAQDVTPQERT